MAPQGKANTKCGKESLKEKLYIFETKKIEIGQNP
jgi:hypothetical protein